MASSALSCQKSEVTHVASFLHSAGHVKPWSMWWSIAQADLAFRAVGRRGHVCEAYTYVSCMIYVPCLVLESYLEEAGSGVTFAHKLVSKIFGGPQKIPQRIRCFFFFITNCITHLAVACCPPTEGPTRVRWRPSDLVGQFSTSIWARKPNSTVGLFVWM